MRANVQAASRYLELSRHGLQRIEHVKTMVLMCCGHLLHGFGKVPRSLTSEVFRWEDEAGCNRPRDFEDLATLWGKGFLMIKSAKTMFWSRQALSVGPMLCSGPGAMRASEHEPRCVGMVCLTDLQLPASCRAHRMLIQQV